MERNRKKIGGLCFHDCTMAEAVAQCTAFLQGSRCRRVVTVNSEIGYEAMVDEAVRTLLNTADLVVADGAGVLLGGKLCKTPLVGTVPGADLAQALLPVLVQNGQGLYLLGGRPGVARLAADKLTKQYPGLRIAGVCDGYFSDEAAVVQAIAQSGADALYVCLGFPKQERFIEKHGDELAVKLAIGLGGTLDVLAGVTKRAPILFQKLHLEFLYRLIKEPRRFGRMLRIPKYLWRLIRGGTS